MLSPMDIRRAALIHLAHDNAKWAAMAVERVRTLRKIGRMRPLSPLEMDDFLDVHEQLLVRLTQRDTALEWAAEMERRPWWRFFFRRG